MSSSCPVDDADAASNDGNTRMVLIAIADLPQRPMSPDERDQEMAAAQQLISTKYHAGVPLFNKEAMQDVVQQLDKCKNDSSLDQGVSITGLDGRSVWFPIETGKVYNGFFEETSSGKKCIQTKPFLEYQAFDRLLAIDEDTFSPIRAYLPFELAHLTELRDAQTNELVEDPWLTSDYDAVRTKFDGDRHAWETSDHCAQLKSLLASAGIPSGTNKVVAFACSTMAWREDLGVKTRSIDQHVLALTVRDVLASLMGENDSDGNEVKCFAQEPSYTEVDERILQEESVTVLDDPRAFLEVDEASVVISSAPDIPLRQIVADIARPAVVIWDRVIDEDEDGTLWTDPVTSRVKDMMKDYIELEFPFQDTSFQGLAIYVRKHRETGFNSSG